MEIVLKTSNTDESRIFTSDFSYLNSFVSSRCENKRVFALIDKKILNFPAYSSLTKNLDTFAVTASERFKTLKTAERIYKFLLEKKADRDSFILAIGGGITLDIAGFVASTYMRGMKFGFIPTTLLAMVDASIGGKNGVNFLGYKNYVGTFNHPEFVAICPYFLKTLPKKQFNVGLAEVIKYGAINDKKILDFLEDTNSFKALKEEKNLKFIIEKSAKIKAEIVEKDFTESGLRKILNFGHTLGHALERIKKVSHGEGVAAGMIFAAFLSVKYGYLKEENLRKLEKILKKYSLPVFIDHVSEKEIIEGIAGDKKKSGDLIQFVLLKDFGKPFVKSLTLSEIEEGLNDLRKHYGK